jgi:hypothetical protein
MEERRKTPREIFQEYQVSKQGWTQIPNPEVVFGHLDKNLEYLKCLFQSARIFFDNYMASLEYEILAKEDRHLSHQGIQPKYANPPNSDKPEKRDIDLPLTREALPNHIAKDQRENFPTVAECVRARKMHANHKGSFKFGRAA